MLEHFTFQAQPHLTILEIIDALVNNDAAADASCAVEDIIFVGMSFDYVIKIFYEFLA